MALLYLGAAAQQRGDLSEAETFWKALLNQSEPGSADYTMVQSLLDRIGDAAPKPQQ